MDLANLGTTQDSVKMELRHPKTNEVLRDKEGKAFTISLLSADTNKYKSEFNKVLRSARDAKEEQTAQDQSVKACQLLADVTTDCYFVFGEKQFAFSNEAIAKLYVKPEYTWIREQVAAFINDRANFIVS